MRLNILSQFAQDANGSWDLAPLLRLLDHYHFISHLYGMK